MIDGHGDDAYKYGQKIRINFSSNVYNHVIDSPNLQGEKFCHPDAYFQ